MPLRSDPSRGRGAARARRCLLAAVLVAVLGLAGAFGAGAQEASPATRAEITAALEERFDLVKLRRGWLLTDRDDGVGALEVAGGEVALDGQVVSADELRRELGDETAELVLRFAALAPETGVARVAEAEDREAEEGPSDDVEEPADEADREIEAEIESESDEEGDEAVPRDRRDRSQRSKRYQERDQPVSVGGALTIEKGDTAKDAMALGGPLTVYGRVLGDAVSLGNSVTVRGGEVTGEVLAIGGSVYLEDGAEVHGGAVSLGGKIHKDSDVTLRGDVVEIPFAPKFALGPFLREAARDHPRHDDFFDFTPLDVATRSMWGIFGLIVLALLACLAYLLGRGPVERIERKAAQEPWKSGLAGLLTQILCIPLLVMIIVILAVSIIGIPLLLLVPFVILAFLVVCFLGYVAVALGLGRFLEGRFGWNLGSPFVAILVGVGLIQIWWLIGRLLDVGWGPLWFLGAMFMLFGGLLKYVVWTVGMGAAVLTRFGTAESWGVERDWAPPPPAPPAEAPGYEAPPPPSGYGAEPVEPGPAPEDGWGESEPPEEKR